MLIAGKIRQFILNSLDEFTTLQLVIHSSSFGFLNVHPAAFDVWEAASVDGVHILLGQGVPGTTIQGISLDRFSSYVAQYLP